MAATTIQVRTSTRYRLAQLKSDPRETYDELLRKMMALIPEGDEEGQFTEASEGSIGEVSLFADDAISEHPDSDKAGSDFNVETQVGPDSMKQARQTEISSTSDRGSLPSEEAGPLPDGGITFVQGKILYQNVITEDEAGKWLQGGLGLPEAHPYREGLDENDRTGMHSQYVDDEPGATQILLFFDFIDIQIAQGGVDHDRLKVQYYRVGEANPHTAWDSEIDGRQNAMDGRECRIIGMDELSCVNLWIVVRDDNPWIRKEYVRLWSDTDGIVYGGYNVKKVARDNWRLPVRWAEVQIWAMIGYYPIELLDRTFTSYDGQFMSRPIPNSNGLDIGVYVYASNCLWSPCNTIIPERGEVATIGGALYYELYGPYIGVGGGTLNLGEKYISDGQNSAWIVFNTLQNGYDYLADGPAHWAPGKVRARWEYGHHEDYSWYTNGGDILLDQYDAQGLDPVLHEYGHFVMYKAYGDYSWGCNRRDSDCSHVWQGIVVAPMAWMEGWADFFPIPVQLFWGMGNEYFDKYGPDGYRMHISLEDRPWWTGADHTEGAIAAALYDIYDSNNDGLDYYNGGFLKIWNTLRLGQDPNNRQLVFADWWHAWKYHANPSAFDVHFAKMCIYENTINYNALPWVAGLEIVTPPSNGWYRGTIQVHAQIGEDDPEDLPYLVFEFQHCCDSGWGPFYHSEPASPGWHTASWDTTAHPDVNNWFRALVSDGMESVWSDIIFIVDNTPPSAPGTPTCASGDERDGIFTLGWTPGSDPSPGSGVWQFELQQRISPDGLWNTISSTIPWSSWVTYVVGYLSPGAYDFQVRSEDRAGNWGPFSETATITIPWDVKKTGDNPPPRGQAKDSDVAVDASGNSHIVWSDNRYGNYEIFYKKVDSQWEDVGPEIRLTTTSGDSVTPTIAVTSSGTIYVLWSEFVNGNWQIWGATYHAGSGWSNVPSWTSGGTGQDLKQPDAAVDSYGNLYYTHRKVSASTKSVAESILAWRYPSGPTWGVTIYTMSGPVITPPHMDRLFSPRIGVSALNEIHVVWSRGPAYPVESGTSWIYYKKYVYPKLGPLVQLGTDHDAPRSVSISVASSRVYTAWDRYVNDFDICFRKSNNNGVDWPTNLLSCDTSAGNQVSPDIGAGPNGKVYLTYTDNSRGHYELYLKKSTGYGDTGTWSSPIRMTNTLGDSRYQHISMDAMWGKFSIVFADNRDGTWQIYFLAKWL